MQAQLLAFGSPAQIQSLALRHEVLRKPLGLVFDPADLAKEDTEYHFGVLDGAEVVACLILKDMGQGLLKMRQVAVKPALQGRGVGKLLVRFSEQWALDNHFTRMELHARDTAIPFYLSLGYHILGDPFSEVGIPHHKMGKDLKD